VVQIANDEWKGFSHHDVDIDGGLAVYDYSKDSGQLGRLLQSLSEKSTVCAPYAP
jgi:hypothetical protein